jgi:hypothetical protein
MAFLAALVSRWPYVKPETLITFMMRDISGPPVYEFLRQLLMYTLFHNPRSPLRHIAARRHTFTYPPKVCTFASTFFFVFFFGTCGMSACVCVCVCVGCVRINRPRITLLPRSLQTCIFQYLCMDDHLSLGQCSRDLNMVARLPASSPAWIALDATCYEWRSYFRPATVTLALFFSGERERKLCAEAGAIMSASRDVTLYCNENECGDLALDAYRAIFSKLARMEVLTIAHAHARLHGLLDNAIGLGIRRLRLTYVRLAIAKLLLMHCTNVERLALSVNELGRGGGGDGGGYDGDDAVLPPDQTRLCPKLQALSVRGATSTEWLEQHLDRHISELEYTTSCTNSLASAAFVTSSNRPSMLCTSLTRLSIDSERCTFKGHWSNLQQLFVSHVALRGCDIDLSGCPRLHTIVLTTAYRHSSIVSKRHVRAFVAALLKLVDVTQKRTIPLQVIVHPELRLCTSSWHSSNSATFRSVATFIRRLVKKKSCRRRITVLRAITHLRLDI